MQGDNAHLERVGQALAVAIKPRILYVPRRNEAEGVLKDIPNST